MHLNNDGQSFQSYGYMRCVVHLSYGKETSRVSGDRHTSPLLLAFPGHDRAIHDLAKLASSRYRTIEVRGQLPMARLQDGLRARQGAYGVLSRVLYDRSRVMDETTNRSVGLTSTTSPLVVRASLHRVRLTLPSGKIRYVYGYFQLLVSLLRRRVLGANFLHHLYVPLGSLELLLSLLAVRVMGDSLAQFCAYRLRVSSVVGVSYVLRGHEGVQYSVKFSVLRPRSRETIFSHCGSLFQVVARRRYRHVKAASARRNVARYLGQESAMFLMMVVRRLRDGLHVYKEVGEVSPTRGLLLRLLMVLSGTIVRDYRVSIVASVEVNVSL